METASAAKNNHMAFRGGIPVFTCLNVACVRSALLTKISASQIRVNELYILQVFIFKGSILEICVCIFTSHVYNFLSVKDAYP
jgi:hypothetical protein